MATGTFDREKAKILELYRHRITAAGKDKYLRVPFNLITHDNGVQYIQPLDYSQGAFQWSDINYDAVDGEFLIVDTVPFSGVFEIL